MEAILDEGTMTFIVNSTVINSTFGVFLVNIIKAWFASRGRTVDPKQTALAVNIALVGLSWVFQAVNKGDVFDNALKWGEVVAPALVNLLTVALGMSALYKGGKILDAPGVAYKPEAPPLG